MKISELSNDTQDHISSGIAIPSILTILIELIHNSIDANSSNIEIKLNLSNWSLEVKDNGIGISENHLKNYFGRYHYTNKQYDKSYGYKGSAIASISQISQLIVISTTENSNNSYIWRSYQRNNIDVKRKICNGTTVIVKDIFYNLPVRRKAIRLFNEYTRIKEFVQSIALLYFDISWHMVDLSSKGWKVIFHSTAKRSVYDRFSEICECQLMKTLQTIDITYDNIKVKGLLSPILSATCHYNKEYQYLYINNYPILNKSDYVYNYINSKYIKLLNHSLLSNYSKHSSNKSNSFPNFVLQLLLPYEDYEINKESDSSYSSTTYFNIINLEKLLERMIKSIDFNMNFDKLDKTIETLIQPEYESPLKYNYDDSKLFENVFLTSPTKRKYNDNDNNLYSNFKCLATSDDEIDQYIYNIDGIRQPETSVRISRYSDCNKNNLIFKENDSSYEMVTPVSNKSKYFFDIPNSQSDASVKSSTHNMTKSKSLDSNYNSIIFGKNDININTNDTYFNKFNQYDHTSNEIKLNLNNEISNDSNNTYDNMATYISKCHNEDMVTKHNNSNCNDNFNNSNINVNDCPYGESILNKRYYDNYQSSPMKKSKYFDQDIRMLGDMSSYLDNSKLNSNSHQISNSMIIINDSVKKFEKMADMVTNINNDNSFIDQFKVNLFFDLDDIDFNSDKSKDFNRTVTNDSNIFNKSNERQHNVLSMNENYKVKKKSKYFQNNSASEAFLDNIKVNPMKELFYYSDVNSNSNVTRDMLKHSQVIGKLDNKFIILYSSDGYILVVDQHAADERIIYESLLHTTSIFTKSVNYEIKLSKLQLWIVKNKDEYIKSFGFNFLVKSNDYLVLFESPVIIKEILTDQDFLEFIDCLSANIDLCGINVIKPPAVNRILTSNACQQAIKFNQSISVNKCEQIVQSLSGTNLPFICAHGRPSVIPLLKFNSLFH